MATIMYMLPQGLFSECLVCSGSHYCIQLCAISLSAAAVFVCCRRLLCAEIFVLKNKLTRAAALSAIHLKVLPFVFLCNETHILVFVHVYFRYVELAMPLLTG